MEKFSFLYTSIEENTITITINRPDSLNALNAATLEEIRTVIQEVYDDDSIKGAIITGAGERAFVAGADITEIAELNEMNARKFSENGQEIFDLIENCPKPVIAVVNGFALGGGCELAMACHMRVATTQAKLGLPEVSLGIIPGYGGTQRLTQLVGKGRAIEMMSTGEMISAEEAHRIGLLNHVQSDKEAALHKAEEILNKVFKNGPIAVGNAIECANLAMNNEENGFQAEANSFANCVSTDDFREGTAAFLEKRKPEFKGE
jgi:enoyl-CoA hydratase